MTRRESEPPAETAARWLLRMERGATQADEAALDAWLAADAAHEDALEQVRAAQAVVARHAGTEEMAALREAALKVRPERRGFAPTAAAAAVVLALVGAGALWASRLPSAALPVGELQAWHATGLGERSAVTLPDGSVMTLNTGSRARVDYSGDQRLVQLEAGQALFEVASRTDAPFRVIAGEEVVTATGTAFEVRLEGSRVQVALLEGLVAVRRAGAATDMRLLAGELLTAETGGPVRVRAADVERLTRWRDGLVEFADEPLEDAAAEMNRYSRTSLRIADPQAGRWRISGTFKVGESERFAATAAELFPIEVHTSGQGELLLVSRP